MYKILITFLFFTIFNRYSLAQIGFGTNIPDPSSEIDIASPLHNKGLLIPRLTEQEKLNINNPANGLIVYQTDNETGMWYFQNGIWSKVSDVSQNLWFHQGYGIYNSNQSTVNNHGLVGIGNTSALARLHIVHKYCGDCAPGGGGGGNGQLGAYMPNPSVINYDVPILRLESFQTSQLPGSIGENPNIFDFFITPTSFQIKNGITSSNPLTILNNNSIGFNMSSPDAALSIKGEVINVELMNLRTESGIKTLYVNTNGKVICTSDNNTQADDARMNINETAGTVLKLFSNHASDYGYNTLIHVNRNNTKALTIKNIDPTIDKEKFVVYGNGKTIIGEKTITTGQHAGSLLSVDGKVSATAFVVTQQNWNDSRCTLSYSPISIEEQFNEMIQLGHLLDLPSEAELFRNGNNMADTDARFAGILEDHVWYFMQLQNENKMPKIELEKLKLEMKEISVKFNLK